MKYVITGLGAVSNGGYDVEQNFTTIRSGISVVEESDEFRIRDMHGVFQSVVCASAVGVTDGQRRFLRNVRLAVFACYQAIEQARIEAVDIPSTSLFLALHEEERVGTDDRLKQHLASRLATKLDLGDLVKRSRTISIGHAGVYWCIKAAIAELSSGVCERAIIGGVDSYLDEQTLQQIYDDRRLKCEDWTEGFIPGEAAGFFVLETSASASRRKVEPIVELLAPGTAMEPNPLYSENPSKGDGLVNCIRATLDELDDSGSDLTLIVCDLNGERYRSIEWGFVIPRALGGLKNDYEVIHPADSIGDACAGSAAVNICFASSAICDSSESATSALLWGSSECGERGSVYMTAT